MYIYVCMYAYRKYADKVWTSRVKREVVVVYERNLRFFLVFRLIFAVFILWKRW